MDQRQLLSDGMLLKGIVLLSIAAFGLYATKAVLSDCTIFSKVNCSAEKNQIASVNNDIVGIQRQIDLLRSGNSNLECPQIEVPNANQSDAPKIDSSLWEKGDLEVLAGCWNLDWDYEMYRENTGEAIGVASWNVLAP